LIFQPETNFKTRSSRFHPTLVLHLSFETPQSYLLVLPRLAAMDHNGMAGMSGMSMDQMSRPKPEHSGMGMMMYATSFRLVSL
jgi:hypothetical protein